jgi:hypothetical protein
MAPPRPPRPEGPRDQNQLRRPDYLWSPPGGRVRPVMRSLAVVLEYSQPLTIHLHRVEKIAIRDMANAKGVSMAALVREWIDERLDLPELA